MGIETIGNQSQATNQLLYSSLVAAGMQEAYLADQELFYMKIARCQMPSDFAAKFPNIVAPDGSMMTPSAALPQKAFFAQAMPIAVMEDLDVNGGGATSFPVIRQVQDVTMSPREVKTHISVWNWRSDVQGSVQAVAGLLARSAEKKADYLLSDLLNAGNTASCWFTAATGGKHFFDTNIPCDLSDGLNGQTFTNYRTNYPLTAANLAKAVGQMQTIKAGDKVPVRVKPDTLIVPTQMTYDADVATLVGSIVYGGANLAPGQPANTAAQGDNVNYIRKYIKHVVYADVLADDADANQLSTWYLADSRSYGLLYARALAPQYAWQVSPNDFFVFEENMYKFKVNTWEGAGYGLPQFIQKCRGL